MLVAVVVVIKPSARSLNTESIGRSSGLPHPPPPDDFITTISLWSKSKPVTFPGIEDGWSSTPSLRTVNWFGNPGPPPFIP